MWTLFVWALYADSKFAYLADEFSSRLGKCQYWVTILGIVTVPRVFVAFMETMLMAAQVRSGVEVLVEVEGVLSVHRVVAVLHRVEGVLHRVVGV